MYPELKMIGGCSFESSPSTLAGVMVASEVLTVVWSTAALIQCDNFFTAFRSANEKASGFPEKMAKTPTTSSCTDTGTAMMDRTPSCRQTSWSTRASDSVSLHHCDIWR